MDVATQRIDEFLAAVAAERVAPAGGTAVAVVGAAGAALCEMVCIHSADAADGENGNGNLADARAELHAERDRLLALADADAAVVDELFGGDGAEPALSGEGAGAAPAASAMKRATGVPLAIAESCLVVLEVATTVAERAGPNVVIDAATGAFLAHGALRAAVFTVRSNLPTVDDDGFAAEMERRATDLEAAAASAFEETLGTVERRR